MFYDASYCCSGVLLKPNCYGVACDNLIVQIFQYSSLVILQKKIQNLLDCLEKLYAKKYRKKKNRPCQDSNLESSDP